MGHKNKNLINRISVLTRGRKEAAHSIALHTCRGLSRKVAIWKSRRETPADINISGTMVMDVCLQEMSENKFMLTRSSIVWFLLQKNSRGLWYSYRAGLLQQTPHGAKVVGNWVVSQAGSCEVHIRQTPRAVRRRESLPSENASVVLVDTHYARSIATRNTDVRRPFW